MKIGLVNVDSLIPNLALMKISAREKSLGNSVKIYDPLFDKPDLIYSAKVFDFTPDFQFYPDCEIVKGGLAYNNTELSTQIEHTFPDYGIFNCMYAMGFTSRGCIRKCAFCKVPEKEGNIREVADIYEFWTGQKQLKLLDNNLTALPDHFERVVKQMIKEKVQVDFNQGLDIRLITADQAKLLSKVRLYKQIHFAFDHVNHEQAVRKGIDILTSNGVVKSRLMFYVLIGFDSTPEEDLYRVMLLRDLGIDPFIMPFNKSDEYQRRFARWVNMKAVFKTVPWEKYSA